MVAVADILFPRPEPWWPLLRQVGVEKVVSFLVDGEQEQRWHRLLPGAPRGAWQEVGRDLPPRGRRGWDVDGLRSLRDVYREHGFELAALEDTPPMDLVRLGRPGRDEQIEWFQDMVRAAAEVGIPVCCYNWLAIGTWARTDVAVPGRGGALLTGFDDTRMREQEPLLDAGEATHEEMWEALAYFLAAVVPVADECGVKLALHPDDPPIPSVRGVPRIMNSLSAFDRLIELQPSAANGICFCQGNFTLMTDDVPAAIRRYAGRIHFVHLRDVRGTATDFVETFHDDGPTDLIACLRAYREIGFDGCLRADHVPTLHGESNEKPGYAVLGRLHALGYITGIRESVFGKRAH